jgi:trehalose 6-phosphate synthase/phosphatase
METIISAAYQKANHRLLLLDYDGTLVNIKSTPDKSPPTKRLLKILNKLKSDPKNHIIIVSGRTQTVLNNWLGDLDITLIAEHGLAVKEPNLEWIQIETNPQTWQPMVQSLMQIAINQLPDSFIEFKQASLAWHYRLSNKKLAQAIYITLLNRLNSLNFDNYLDIMPGHKVIEVKLAGYDKGTSVKKIINNKKYDFILIAGDDVTDERLFSAFEAKAFTIKIGPGISEAKYQLNNPTELLNLLTVLVKNQ